PAKQRQRLVRDAILGEVEEDASRLRGQALAALRVVGEEGTQVDVAELLVVALERLPRGTRGQWRRFRHGSSFSSQPALRAAFLDAITSISSRQEGTNDLAPSSWSRAARASTLTPAAANRARTSSLSPPSAVRIPPSDP